ncbi:MAG: chromate efflux transporter [bacterium]|nr:chromate efflux transporter [bacterium]
MAEEIETAEKSSEEPTTLRELAALFLRVGVLGFGGPAAHIAMMEEEVVERRKWFSHQAFLDLVGATSLIPGPNSTEMAIHVGYIRAGLAGLLVAGFCFIFPAVFITTAFAWGYVHYGALPQVAPFLYGIKPAVLAVILGAVWRLGRRAVKGWRLMILGTAVTLVSLTDFHTVLALLGGGLVGMFWLRAADRGGDAGAVVAGVLALPKKAWAATVLAAGGAGAGVSLWPLGLFFLKVGAVLYGSGYVLVAFLEKGLVQEYGWLTQQQLLEAIAIGQFTPGPVLSTAAFIGYVIAGMPGAAVASAAIFLPSFLFVVALNPLLPHLRRSRWMAAFLDAVNVCAVGVMAGVMLELSAQTLVDWPAMLIGAVAAVAGVWRNVSAVWLILGGGLVGWVWIFVIV